MSDSYRKCKVSDLLWVLGGFAIEPLRPRKGELVRAYVAKGYSSQHIADLIGCSLNSVVTQRSRQRCSARTWRRFSEAELATLVALRTKGASVSAIGRVLGRHRGTIAWKLREQAEAN